MRHSSDVYRPVPTQALAERRARILREAGRLAGDPRAFADALAVHGVARGPDLAMRVRRALAARRAAAELGPWWSDRHVGFHALAIAAARRPRLSGFAEVAAPWRGPPAPEGYFLAVAARPDR